MSDLDAQRQRLERERAGEPEVYHCPVHGKHPNLVCLECYAVQQERVERESLPLRMATTTENQRKWVLEELAKRNGHEGG